MQTFNLVPVYQNINLSNVVNKSLNIDMNINDVKKLSALFAEKKKGLMVLWEIVELPVKYNLRGMTDKKVILESKIAPYSGIDHKVMKKYKTIILGKKSDVKITIEKLGDLKSDSWLILRTLDGIKFDILTQKRKKLFHSKYFVDKIQRPSPRIQMYQEQKNKKLLEFVKTPQEIFLNEKYDEASAISGLLKIKFEAYAEQQLQTNFPTTLLDFHTMFKTGDIFKIISQVLMDSFLEYEHGKNKIETMGTFVYIIENLSQKTLREINEGFAKSSITENIFTEYTRDVIITIFRRELSDILNLSIHKNFGTNTDFYEMLFVKRALLSINL